MRHCNKTTDWKHLTIDLFCYAYEKRLQFIYKHTFAKEYLFNGSLCCRRTSRSIDG